MYNYTVLKNLIKKYVFAYSITFSNVILQHAFSSVATLRFFPFTHLIGQCADDDAQVGQGAVDSRHLFKALTLRLALKHPLTAS